MNGKACGWRCFVTGATGLVGTHVVRALLERNWHVVALKRPSHGFWGVSHPRLHVLERELADLQPEDMAGCSVFLHLAALMPTPDATLRDYLDVNLCQAVHAFRCAAQARVPRCIQIGSCFEFGLSGNEAEWLCPAVSLQPVGGYSVSKAAASLALLDWARDPAGGAESAFSLLRLFHIFGPGEREERFWPALRRAAAEGRDFPMTAGAQVRDFTPVAYAAERILYECGRTDLTPGRPVVRQIGTGRPQTLRRFAEYWWRHWNARGQLLFGAVPYRSGEVMRFAAKVEAPAPPELCPWAPPC